MLSYVRFSLICIIYLLGFSDTIAQINIRTLKWKDKYESIRPSENVFIVSKGEKMAIANQSGILLTKWEFDTIYNFHDGIAIVGKGEREVNQFGKVLMDFKYGYVNKAGKLILPTEFEHINPFQEGLGLIEALGDAKLYKGHSGYIFIDKTGQVILNPKHVYLCMPFYGNTAYVEVSQTGFWLAPYDDGRNNGHHKQLYDANGNNIYGNYIDREGNLLIPRKFDTIAPYVLGYLRPVKKAGKWGFVDSMAILRVFPQFTDIDTQNKFFWQKLRRVGLEGRFGFLDTQNGKLVIPLRYEDTKPSMFNHVWIREKHLWGCLNKAGRLFIEFKYTNVYPSEKGVSIVQQSGKWGVIDTTGQMLTEIMYDEIMPFHEAEAVFKMNGKFGFLGLDGQEKIKATYSQVSSFKQGYAFAIKWGLFIKLNKDGNWVSVKLQRVTLKWLIICVGLLILVIILLRKRRQAINGSV
jgi:hypothetical protein